MISWLLVVHLSGPLVGDIAGTYATPSECLKASLDLPRASCYPSKLPVVGAICLPKLGAYAVLPPCRNPKEVWQ
jgi:hypothetical protein